MKHFIMSASLLENDEKGTLIPEKFTWTIMLAIHNMGPPKHQAFVTIIARIIKRYHSRSGSDTSRRKPHT